MHDHYFLCSGVFFAFEFVACHLKWGRTQTQRQFGIQAHHKRGGKPIFFLKLFTEGVTINPAFSWQARSKVTEQSVKAAGNLICSIFSPDWINSALLSAPASGGFKFRVILVWWVFSAPNFAAAVLSLCGEREGWKWLCFHHSPEVNIFFCSRAFYWREMAQSFRSGAFWPI